MKNAIFKLDKIFKFKPKNRKVKTFAENISEEICSLFEFLTILEVIERIKDSEYQVFPVVGFSGELKGVLKLEDLASFVVSVPENEKPRLAYLCLNSLKISQVEPLKYDATYEEIARAYSESQTKIIPLIDGNNCYADKCITPKSLILIGSNLNRPRTIGGLATPLGVYMTDGHFVYGAGIPGLLLTGVIFSVVLNSITLLTIELSKIVNLSESLLLIIQLSIFICILRVSPLSGLHAAEHQTIHAIEKGLELTKENVKNQPRAHIRCGTNYMILLISFSLLISLYYDYLLDSDFFIQTMFVAGITSLILWGWRKAGENLQNFLTTAEASDKQLESGIKAGKELLNNYANGVIPKKLKPMEKIWNTGLIQILSAFSLTSIIFHMILSGFNL